MAERRRRLLNALLIRGAARRVKCASRAPQGPHHIFFVTEFAPGGTIYKRIERGNGLVHHRHVVFYMAEIKVAPRGALKQALF